MLIDLTYPLNDKVLEMQLGLVAKDAILSRMDLFGHVGTHLDLMGKVWPDDYFVRQGRVFDVRHVNGREVAMSDVAMDDVNAGEFVFFNTGSLAKHTYATKEYLSAAVQLSWDLIHALVERQVAMIGLDCTGARSTREHKDADLYCAERGVFIVENIYNLELLSRKIEGMSFLVRTFPLRLEGSTGLPCRIIAEI